MAEDSTNDTQRQRSGVFHMRNLSQKLTGRRTKVSKQQAAGNGRGGFPPPRPAFHDSDDDEVPTKKGLGGLCGKRRQKTKSAETEEK